MGRRRLLVAASAAALLQAGLARPACAQTSPPGEPPPPVDAQTTVGEIVVTAQKREQSINTVGLSVQAATGSQLENQGVRTPQDLAKIVPGFTFTPSPYATPVYTLRGVGLYDSGFASAPSVSVYVDEVPLAFPLYTKAAGLDVERVEVLKGPQGTLFGQSSTGGAVNYIAAKPTSTFKAGVFGQVDEDGQVDVETFVSGPITDTLKARLALRTDQGGAWQRSTSRDDSLGDAGLTEGRLLLDWTPTDRVRVEVNLNGYVDASDPIAPSLVKVSPFNPALVAPGFTSSIPARAPRDADWPAGYPRQNNSFYQGSVRADVRLTDNIKLTSISSYQHSGVSQHLPFSGTPLPYQNIFSHGNVTSYNEELRLAGQHDRLNWLGGVSYEHVRGDENLNYDQTIVSNRQPIPSLAPYTDVNTELTQTSDTYAVFGNADYRLTDRLTVRGGVRYTTNLMKGRGCSSDPIPGDTLPQLFQVLQFLVKGSAVPIGTGQCASLDANFNPAAADLRLDQDNVSWRVGADYRLGGGALLYATISRGYKNGIFPNVAASRTFQYQPAVQEKLDAYEVGVKAPMFQRRLQLNASAFFYDYTDKQIRGSLLDPVFGKLETEINVPKSRIVGLELEAVARPIRGLTASLGATYLDSDVTRDFSAYNSDGVLINAGGSNLPFTPKVQLVGDAEYAWDVGRDLQAFVGGDFTYHSADNSSLRTKVVPADEFRINAYVISDFRIGVQSPDGRWRASVFVRNAFDTLHWDTVFRTIDDYFRYQERPRQFGASLRYLFN